MDDTALPGREPFIRKRTQERQLAAVGCVALAESTYRGKLSGAGFEAVDLKPTRDYRAADAKQLLEEAGLSDDAIRESRRTDQECLRARLQADCCREGLRRTNLRS